MDFLIEAGGRVTPIEVKLGTPDGRYLPRLARMAEPSWQSGRVLSLTSLRTDTNAAVLADGWLSASPLDLSFLDHGR